MPNKHIGSTFASFLDEEGISEEVDLLAKKKMLADEMVATMKRKSVTRTELAKRMKTSRTQINRLLDPEDTSFTFVTLAKASMALELNLLVSLEPKRTRATRHRRR